MADFDILLFKWQYSFFLIIFLLGWNSNSLQSRGCWTLDWELAEQQFIFFPSCIKWWNRWLLYLNQQSHMKERATSGQTPRKMVFIKYYHPKKLIHYSDNCLNFKSFISQRCSYRRQLNSTSLRSVEHISTVIIFHSLFKIKMHFRLAVTCILT